MEIRFTITDAIRFSTLAVHDSIRISSPMLVCLFPCVDVWVGKISGYGNTAGSTIIIAKSCDVNAARNCCAPHNLCPRRSAFPHPHSLRRTSCEAELTCESEATEQTTQQRTRMIWTHNISSQLSVHADYRVHHLTTPCSVTHMRTTRSNLYMGRAPADSVLGDKPTCSFQTSCTRAHDHAEKARS